MKDWYQYACFPIDVDVSFSVNDYQFQQEYSTIFPYSIPEILQKISKLFDYSVQYRIVQAQRDSENKEILSAEYSLDNGKWICFDKRVYGINGLLGSISKLFDHKIIFRDTGDIEYSFDGILWNDL